MFGARIEQPMKRDLIAFVLMLIIVVFTWSDNLVAGMLLFIEFLAVTIPFYTKDEMMYFSIVGVLGILIEMAGSMLKIFKYTEPNLLTIPHWVFFVWGFTFMFLIALYNRVLNKR
jgi:hypothetical protein